MRTRKSLTALLIATASAAAFGQAQTGTTQTPAPPQPPLSVPVSSLAIYGTLDQYVSHIRSSSGTSITALEDGAYLRSRFGFRGMEALGGGLYARFQLEAGFSTDNGLPADAGRAFDRQAWVGLGSAEAGEVRLGRQNTVIFGRGDFIDPTSRTLGSVINAFGVPSRFDNDISYTSPRLAGLLFEAHYALGESTYKPGTQGIYQVGLDYLNGPYRVGYAGLRARAPETALYTTDVRYDNLYANYDYGKGKVYVAYVRTNNSTSTSAGNNTGTILGNVGGLVAGNNPDVNRYYRIWQLSADYRVASNFRVAALYGRIDDTSNTGRDANGAALAGYYDLSRRTMLYAIAERLSNATNAGFRLAGSGALKSNFTSASDVNGQSVKGVQVGVLHRF